MVVIKSYQSGISLHINNEQPFDEILEEVGTKFEDSRRFFKNAAVALSIEGRRLNLAEEKRLIQTINNHSDLNIICLVGKDEVTNKSFVKALKRVDASLEETNCRFYTGNVVAGQVVEGEGNLVICGNVDEEATVIAAKNVVILGTLAGEAIAGVNNEPGHFVLALKMIPSEVKIGSLSYTASSKGLFARKKGEPRIIFEKDGELINESANPEIFADVTSI